jgi:Leucine-rich repeat (LRR) protein
MAPEDVADNFYLVYLSLATCGIETWPPIVSYNLQTLDLSYNLIKGFSLEHAFALSNLHTLNLKRNPLVSFTPNTSSIQHASLVSLDLSHTRLTRFDTEHLALFSNIESLNLSYSDIQLLSKNGLVILPQLVTIDLIGNSIHPAVVSASGRGSGHLQDARRDGGPHVLGRQAAEDFLCLCWNAQAAVCPQHVQVDLCAD